MLKLRFADKVCKHITATQLSTRTPKKFMHCQCWAAQSRVGAQCRPRRPEGCSMPRHSSYFNLNAYLYE